MRIISVNCSKLLSKINLIKRLKNISIAILLLAFGQSVFAGSGLFFSVTSSGTPDTTVSITLCLNGKGPLSCQNYNVTALTLSILTTIPNHTYPFAGIKINTPGVTIYNFGTNCIPDSDGYCLFSVSNSTPAIITLNKNIPMVAAGSYIRTGGSQSFPLIATSTNSGVSWTYTLDSAHAQLPTDFLNGGSFHGVNCTGQNCVAGGLYISTNSGNPKSSLIATSTNGGTSWTYTLDSTSTPLPADYLSTFEFNTVSCAGQNCVVAGAYRSTNSGNPSYPLIATSTNSGTSWTYTLDSTSTPLPADYLTTSQFDSASCAGQNCVGAGYYESTNSGNPTYPLIAASTNGGASWTYTLDSASTPRPADFLSFGFFNSVNCAGLNCVAGGYYNSTNSGNPLYPLIATSANGGASWTYTLDSVSTLLPTDYLSNGMLHSVSCAGLNCVAGGDYKSTNSGNPTYPLIATSSDGGATWAYTLDSTSTPLPADYFNTSQLSSINCTGQNCIAVGQYVSTKSGNPTYPLIAASTNGGASWTYTLDSTKTPADFLNSGSFRSVSCTGFNCIAAGSYNSTNSGNPIYPLIATSADGGASWTYTLTSTSTPLPADYFDDGNFDSVSIVNSTRKFVGSMMGIIKKLI